MCTGHSEHKFISLQRCKFHYLPCSLNEFISTLQEVDEEDEKAFEAFMSKDTPARRTLADVIMEKIQDKKTEIESQMSGT